MGTIDGFDIVTVGCCVYPIPAFLNLISDIVPSARRFASATAGTVLRPVSYTHLTLPTSDLV